MTLAQLIALVATTFGIATTARHLKVELKVPAPETDEEKEDAVARILNVFPISNQERLISLLCSLSCEKEQQGKRYVSRLSTVKMQGILLSVFPGAKKESDRQAKHHASHFRNGKCGADNTGGLDGIVTHISPGGGRSPGITDPSAKVAIPAFLQK